jgi:hypothetical protein
MGQTRRTRGIPNNKKIYSIRLGYMKKQIGDLEVRIENLEQILILATRYGEDDLQRIIRYKIGVLEREHKILKNRMNIIW